MVKRWILIGQGDCEMSTPGPEFEESDSDLDAVYVHESDYLALVAERDALREKVRELTEWRPMESAPRDGRLVLVRINRESAYLAGYHNHKWVDAGGPHDDSMIPDGWLPLPAVNP